MIEEEHINYMANQIKEGFKTAGLQDDFIKLLIDHPDKVSAYLAVIFANLLDLSVVRTGKVARGQFNDAAINQLLDELKRIYAKEIERLS